MDLAIVLAFLSRPRTIAEVAEHFNIPVSVAEKWVVEAIESGHVVVGSKSVEKKTPTVFPEAPGRTSLSFAPAKSLRSYRENLPKVLTPRKFSPGNENRYSKLRFKLRSELTHLHKINSPPAVSELFAQKNVRRTSGRASISTGTQIRLFEVLQGEPRQLSELHGSLGVSRTTLERFVRRGMVKTIWGSKGVGVFFKLTEKGLRELTRLKAASAVNFNFPRKALVSTRIRLPH